MDSKLDEIGRPVRCIGCGQLHSEVCGLCPSGICSMHQPVEGIIAAQSERIRELEADLRHLQGFWRCSAGHEHARHDLCTNPFPGLAKESAPPSSVPRGHCDRCDRCGWPFGAELGKCRIDDCSMRPLPEKRNNCAGCGAPFILSDEGAGATPVAGSGAATADRRCAPAPGELDQPSVLDGFYPSAPTNWVLDQVNARIDKLEPRLRIEVGNRRDLAVAVDALDANIRDVRGALTKTACRIDERVDALITRLSLVETVPFASSGEWAYDGSNGGHKYDEHGRSDCAFGCGSWAGGYSSGGPDGVDPLGACPKNTRGGK